MCRRDVSREWYSHLAPPDLKHGVIEISIPRSTESAGGFDPIASCPIACDDCRDATMVRAVNGNGEYDVQQHFDFAAS
jgi:hypothetical protein